MVSPQALVGLVPGYINLQAIGSGGFSDVYAAVDACTGEDVAIKIGRLPDPGDTRLTLRGLQRIFDNEWEALNRVDSDRVVRPIAWGTTDADEPYLVLERAEGVTLNAYLAAVEADGIPFDLRQTLCLMLGAAEAVGDVHESGLIHNDVKLNNFVVNEEGAIKLFDLAMAVSLDSAKGRVRNYRGTPGFYSVERVESKRKDVFSLGILCYLLAAGRPPFASMNPLQSMFLRPPNPSDVRPERKIPKRLGRIILKAIAPAPADRYSDALSLAADLERLTQKRPRRRR